jgi:hypothetical protein
MAQRENINCQLMTTSRLRIAKFADFSEKIPPGPRSQPGPTDFGSRFSHSKKRDPLLQIFFFKLKHLIQISFEISRIKMIPYMVLLRIV